MTPRAGLLACGLAVLLQAGSGETAAGIVTLTSVRDNTLIEEAEPRSSGAGPHLFAGRISAGRIRRTLIAFDVPAAVPAGSTILRVELTLHASRGNGGLRSLTLHRVLASWGEGDSSATGGRGAPAEPGDATWLHTFFDTGFWASPGGDFVPEPLAGSAVDQGVLAWESTPEMIADVQGWLDDPGGNHGWLIRGDESEPFTVKRLDSRESPDPALRPSLQVEYAPACQAGAPGPGFWHRQCLGLALDAGGLDPAGGGRGPVSTPEPGFAEETLPCSDVWLSDLGLEETTCQGLDPKPRQDPCERALRSLTAWVLNACSGRLPPACPVPGGAERCGGATVGETIDSAAQKILAGDCRQFARCIRQ